MTLLLTQIFALLTVVVWAGVVGLVASAQLRALVRPHIVGAAAAVTGTATMGSLYLSEIAGYVPCELCWVQRIFMYSLAVILGAALLQRRPAKEVLRYAAPLALFGLATSVWHVIVQRLPITAGSCDPDNPCSAIIIERFGFITIPTMAGTAFVGVLAMWWVVRGTDSNPETTPRAHNSNEVDVSNR